MVSRWVGTELQSKLIYSRLNPKLLKNKNIILSVCDPKRLKKDEIKYYLATAKL